MLFLVIITAMSSSLFGWGMKNSPWRIKVLTTAPLNSKSAYAMQYGGKKQVIESLLGQFHSRINIYTPALKKLFFVSMYNATKNPWWI